MLHVVLYAPRIAPNTGNVIRLCANTGAQLHLIEPLGFTLDDARLRRAGLDYREWATVTVHPDWTAFLRRRPPGRLLALTTRARLSLATARFTPDDILLFGPEPCGLPEARLAEADLCLRIPMRPHSRSLNLSNAVAVVVYEALRQLGWPGLE